MKPDQERVNNLLRDTVTLLCKNGLTYSDELRVEALIGVTVDSNDVFLVHINERFGPGGETKRATSGDKESNVSVNNGGQGLSNSNSGSRDGQSPAQRAQRTASTDSGSATSPTWGGGRQRATHAPQVDLSRVKLESVEGDEDIDDVEECLVVRSPQAVAHPAHFVAGQRRRANSASFHHTPPTHHHQRQQSQAPPSGGGDDAQAMRQQYAQAHSMASSDGSFTDYDPDTGEPPLKIKKQALDDQDDDDGDDSSTYFHGGGGDDGGGGGHGHGHQEASSQWPNLADIAAQQAQHAFQDSGEGHLVADGGSTLPGCSTWPMPAGSQRALLPGTAGSDMGQFAAPAPVVSMPPLLRRRKSRTAVNKPHKCLVPGCERTFFHSQDARRHERQVHKLQHTRGVSPYRAAALLHTPPSGEQTLAPPGGGGDEGEAGGGPPPLPLASGGEELQTLVLPPMCEVDDGGDDDGDDDDDDDKDIIAQTITVTVEPVSYLEEAL